MANQELPYIVTEHIVVEHIVVEHKYNPKYGDDRVCECGHAYYRHFDSYEDMYPCGCKYCDCYTFVETPPTK